jgi:hypothetical protein
VPGEADVMEIGEIKPDSWRSELGTLEAVDQLNRYIRTHAIQYAPGNRWGNPPRSAVPMVTYRGIAPPGVAFGPGGQRLTCESLGNGLYFYSCTRPQKEEKKKKQAQAQSAASGTAATQQQATAAPSLAQMLRAQAPWLPAELAREIAGEPTGLYRFDAGASWRGGFSGTVVAYVNRSSGEIQVYHEYPEDIRFYEQLKAVRARSVISRGDLARRLHGVFTQYNRDLWSLVAPREAGQAFRVSPDYAKAELRGIYAEVLKGVIGGSAALVTAGAAASATMSAVRSAASGQARSGGTLRTVADEPTPSFLRGTPANEDVEEVIQLLKAG